MHRILPLALCLLLLSGLSGCHRDKVYRIGISQCSQDDWRTKMNDEINREIMLHKDAVVEIRSADDSSARQIDDIRYFVQNGFDILIVSPNEAAALTPVIDEVYKAGDSRRHLRPQHQQPQLYGAHRRGRRGDRARRGPLRHAPARG